ncbi:hypothetical protein [Paenibacillus hexagrammi]|uniref:Uncharacterized protein n=1 Tax=Paenibacillus hexagrammi TaxID=2908839 RepID=A0ABY3SH88_9BACL|nr:hypothetical protein [Paenibacillus sp. YPD9-1]UJF32855.1 hypothetical protein L0M14_25295 [Paenibacillus sp. YPD9-1]
MIDFNNYGVRVTDTSGRSFTSKLSEKKSASVEPGQDQTFRFYSSLPTGESADQLQVEVFRWDSSQSDFMNHLGKLSVAAVAQANEGSAPEEILNLHTLDSTLADDASVSFRLGQSVKASEDGKWYTFTQLSVQNLGSSSLKLPSGLQVRLVDASGLEYTASIADGSDQTLLPKQTGFITVKSEVSKQLADSGLNLEFYYMNQTEEVTLGTMNMGGSFTTVALGDKTGYAGQHDGENLTVKAEKSTYTTQADGIHIQTVVTLTNEGDAVAEIPTFLASYEFGDAGASVSSSDNSARDTYLDPAKSVSYYFNAVLPSGVDPNTAQLVLWEKTSTKSTTTSSSTTSNASSSSASSTTAASSTTGTSTSSTSGTGSSTSSTASSSSSNSSSNQMPVAIFKLSGATVAASGFTAANAYTLGDNLTFADNSVIDKNLDISLVEFHVHENDDLGYKTAIGKYKITNKGSSPVAMPELANELVDSKGNSFTGVRQSSAATQVTPGTSYVVSYSYLLPQSEEDDSFALRVFDDKSVSQGSVTLGDYQVSMQKESDSDTISFYPFQVKFNDYNLSWTYNNGSYTYQLDLELDLQHPDPVIVDSNFSGMEFDLVDAFDRVVGTSAMTFTGENKLISGKQKIVFSSLKEEQGSTSYHVNVYETIQTPNGTAKRLVKQLQY